MVNQCGRNCGVFFVFFFLKDHDQQSLKHLVKSNRKKINSRTHSCLIAKERAFQSNAKRTLWLNSCVASKKITFISEANHEKRLQFAVEHKDWTLKQWEKGHLI